MPGMAVHAKQHGALPGVDGDHLGSGELPEKWEANRGGTKGVGVGRWNLRPLFVGGGGCTRPS